MVADDHLDPGAQRAAATSSTAVIAQSTVTISAGAARGEPLHRSLGEAVAIVQPAGDEPVDVGAERAQRADHDRGRADAVDVVVAVHGDPAAGARYARGSRRARRSIPANSAGSWRSRGGEERRAASGSASPRRTRICASTWPMPSSRSSVSARLEVIGRDLESALGRRARGRVQWRQRGGLEVLGGDRKGWLCHLSGRLGLGSDGSPGSGWASPGLDVTPTGRRVRARRHLEPGTTPSRAPPQAGHHPKPGTTLSGTPPRAGRGKSGTAGWIFHQTRARRDRRGKSTPGDRIFHETHAPGGPISALHQPKAPAPKSTLTQPQTARARSPPQPPTATAHRNRPPATAHRNRPPRQRPP